eukprot:701655-Alexandrium_andersonii.AAC.1
MRRKSWHGCVSKLMLTPSPVQMRKPAPNERPTELNDNRRSPTGPPARASDTRGAGPWNVPRNARW